MQEEGAVVEAVARLQLFAPLIRSVIFQLRRYPVKTRGVSEEEAVVKAEVSEVLLPEPVGLRVLRESHKKYFDILDSELSFRMDEFCRPAVCIYCCTLGTRQA
jgi:hypothetical protein